MPSLSAIDTARDATPAPGHRGPPGRRGPDRRARGEAGHQPQPPCTRPSTPRERGCAPTGLLRLICPRRSQGSNAMSDQRPPLSSQAAHRLVLDTEPYLSCDDCFALVDTYVEARLADPTYDRPGHAGPPGRPCRLCRGGAVAGRAGSRGRRDRSHAGARGCSPVDPWRRLLLQELEQRAVELLRVADVEPVRRRLDDDELAAVDRRGVRLPEPSNGTMPSLSPWMTRVGTSTFVRSSRKSVVAQASMHPSAASGRTLAQRQRLLALLVADLEVVAGAEEVFVKSSKNASRSYSSPRASPRPRRRSSGPSGLSSPFSRYGGTAAAKTTLCRRSVAVLRRRSARPRRRPSRSRPGSRRTGRGR